MEITEDQAQEKEKSKTKKGRPRSNQLCAPAGGASSIDRHIYVVLPCRPRAFLPCRPSPSYFRPPQIPFYFFCFRPLPAFPWSGFLPLLLLLSPLPPFPRTPPTADARRRLLLSSASSSGHLTMNRSMTPRYHFPAIFIAVDHSAVSTPSTRGASSVDLSVVRKSLSRRPRWIGSRWSACQSRSMSWVQVSPSACS